MNETRSKNKSFSAKGWIAGIITANILGILAWLLPMLCKNWLLSISLEDFYAKYTATFMFCATWPILQGIILLYHAKKKRDISISRGTEVDIWMILIINLFGIILRESAIRLVCRRADTMDFILIDGFLHFP